MVCAPVVVLLVNSKVDDGGRGGRRTGKSRGDLW